MLCQFEKDGVVSALNGIGFVVADKLSTLGIFEHEKMSRRRLVVQRHSYADKIRPRSGGLAGLAIERGDCPDDRLEALQGLMTREIGSRDT